MATAKNPKKLNTVNVRLTDEALDELRALAAVENRTISNMIQTIVLEGLKARREKAGG